VTLEKQMQKLRWATYASKKLEEKNGSKGTIHKVNDDAPDSLRYFMTLQPELKFDTTRPVYSNYDTLGAVPDSPMPVYDMAYKKTESIYQLYNQESAWELEGTG
jgi:hypothetical protein